MADTDIERLMDSLIQDGYTEGQAAVVLQDAYLSEWQDRMRQRCGEEPT